MRTDRREVDADAADVVDATARMQRVRTAFFQAVEQPPERWREIVAQECAGDEALLEEVMRLLAADQSDFELDLAAVSLGDASEGEERIGDIVAQYRLTRVLGSGGMGTVYEGVRADGVFDQRVAVKLIRSQLGASGMAARFRRERQILAALEHRNIARLLDGGATTQGEPYFVMEYVEGKSITEYCDERTLSIRERMRLFLQVCAAVHHAHGKLIVHRDLKPANMLVSEDGSVKLLDFGVAKLLGAQDGGTATITQSVSRQLTPEYASPEQLRDEPASVASDVYSLGIVLYELVAGKRPHDLPSRSPLAALRAVEGGTPRPSAVATGGAAEKTGESSVARLRKRLAGEVDNIVNQALRADPERRYESAEQLADDIRRYLDGRVVRAQPDSVVYRARKFSRRHWVSVTAATIAIVSLVGGAIGLGLQARRVEIERQRGARVNAFLQKVLSSSDTRWVATGQSTRTMMSIAEVLDDAAKRATVDLARDPVVESAVRKVLGGTYTAMSRWPEAEAQQTRALQLDRQLHAAPVPDIAGDYRDLGISRLGQGDHRAADTLFRAALKLCETHGLKADTAHVCGHSLNDLGLVMLRRNDLVAAESLLKLTLGVARQAAGPVHPAVAIVLTELADVRTAKGDLVGAETLFRQALDMFKQLGPRDFSERASSLGGLALVLETTGRYQEAVQLLEDESRLIDRTEGPTHPDAGLNWIHLGGVHRQMGDGRLARIETDRGLAILEGRLFTTNSFYSKIKAYQALQLIAQGEPLRAKTMLDSVLVVTQARYSPDDPRYGEVRSAMGKSLLALNQASQAEAAFTECVALFSRALGAGHPWTKEAAADLAMAIEARKHQQPHARA
ncbi:MAG: tetratricopeptide repeat protein [bacterium]